ncbi:MAG: hypothetical protein WKG00_21930 [Polyangiaceae bacterium]
MSACFYHQNAAMAGIDLHTYWVAGPPTPAGPTPVPVPLSPHVVAVPFEWRATQWKATHSVTSVGSPMIQRGYDIYAVPHVPVPVGPPHPIAEPLKLLEIHFTAGSEARMSISSVTGCGEQLATCLLFLAGANVNCWDPIPSGPTNLVLSPSSVLTSPTLGDYIGALVGYYVDGAFDFAFGLLGPISGHIWRRAPDLAKLLFGIDGDPADAAQDKVRQLVNEAVEGMGL